MPITRLAHSLTFLAYLVSEGDELAVGQRPDAGGRYNTSGRPRICA
jgi:hypothetical protein